MAITITKLKMWKDSGYTKGCVEVPPAGSKKLPTPDFSSAAGDTLRPRKGSTLTSLELPLSYTQVFDMSYLYIEASDGAGTVSLFGWIDNVSIIATSSDAVRIDWTVDWWRSFSGSVTWGIGRITRTADATMRRPPTIQPRYNKFTKYAEITDTFNTLWVIVAFSDSEKVNNETYTYMKIGVFPVSDNPMGINHIFGTTPEAIGYIPSLKDCYNGLIDEKFGLDPDSIHGVWVSPICPCNGVHISHYSDGQGTEYDYFDFSSCVAGHSKTHNGFILPWVDQKYIAQRNVFITGTNVTETSDDLSTFGIADFQGALAGSFPWKSGGDTAGSIYANVDVGTTSAHLILYQTTTNFYSLVDQRLAASGGCMIKIPLPSIPVNSNAVSSYVYSGQKQYDIESAKVNQDQKFVNNLLGVGSGAITGGVGGAMATSNPVGAIAGASLGTGVALGSAFIQNETDTVFRDRLQGIKERSHVNQASQLITPGDGMLWTKIFPHPYVVKIEADSVTKTEYANMISANGYETEYYASPSTLISTGGAIQVTDLTITGSIPPQAKTSIKTMFEQGVRIVENNPSGVVP